MIIRILIFLWLVPAFVFSQDKVVIVGDSFVGKKIGEYSLREFIGNVVITQRNVKITCDRAIQNLTLEQIELLGSVVITQDTVQIFTDRGFYYEKEGKAFSEKGILMQDGSSELTADTGYYYVELNEAVFGGNVKIIDSVKTLLSDRLFYFDENDSSVAVGNVIFSDTSTVIYSDSLIFKNKTNYAHAIGNTKILNEENSTIVYADELFNYGNIKYALLKGRPLMIKVDSTAAAYDTLYISSDIMETYYDSTALLIAKDSVLLKRGEFSSVNGLTLYYRGEDKIVTYKLNDEAPQPVLWHENSQLTGDSVFVYLKGSTLDSIEVSNKAILISEKPNFNFRYDQISGGNLVLKFEEGKLSRTKVKGNVLSIYYLYEEDEPNGLIKSSAKYAEIIFEENKVIKVNMSGTPVSEYHPENLVRGNEKEFTLPLFRILGVRPTVKEIIGNKKIY